MLARVAQEAALGDVGFKAKAAEVIGAYHPFWARLAMETIIGRSAAGESAGGMIFWHLIHKVLVSVMPQTVGTNCSHSAAL